MRILHIGMTATPNLERGLSKAFKEKSTEYIEIYTGDKEVNSKIIGAAVAFKPELAFIQVQQGGVISDEALVALKKSGSYIVNWTGDCRQPLPAWYVETGKLVDITLFNNGDDIKVMKKHKLKAGFLQEGYDTEIFNPFGKKRKSPEIVFVGTNYGDAAFPLSIERRLIVEALQPHFGDRFGVYGNGWEHGRFVNQEETAEIYRNAKIVINYSHYDCSRYSSNRLVFALACGAFVLTQDYKHLYKDFDKKELLSFQGAHDVVEACEHWLPKEKQRKEIAHNGYIKVRDNYTFDHFVDNLIAMV